MHIKYSIAPWDKSLVEICTDTMAELCSSKKIRAVSFESWRGWVSKLSNLDPIGTTESWVSATCFFSYLLFIQQCLRGIQDIKVICRMLRVLLKWNQSRTLLSNETEREKERVNQEERHRQMKTLEMMRSSTPKGSSQRRNGCSGIGSSWMWLQALAYVGPAKW